MKLDSPLRQQSQRGTCTESKPLYPHCLRTLPDRCCIPGHREQPLTELSPATVRKRIVYMYRTLAKIRPPFSARSLGLLGDWAFNRERRVFIRIYAHPRPQIEVYTLLFANSLFIYCIFILIHIV